MSGVGSITDKELKMRLLALTILSMLTIGCAARTTMVEIPNIDESSSVNIKDFRPESERENEIFSFSISSEAYGIYRHGDELVSPSPIRILQHRIYEKFSNTGIIPEVKVHHFVVYANLKSQLRKGVLGGAIGAAIASDTQKYGVDGLASLTTEEEFKAYEEEYKRALYTQEENPEKVSVYKVYLDAEINGKRTFIKTMTPTTLPEDNPKNPHVVAVETAISYFLDQY